MIQSRSPLLWTGEQLHPPVEQALLFQFFEKCVITRDRSHTYLLNKSLSSCSEENCPKLATNRVEQGELLVWAAMDTPGLWEDVCWTCSVPAPAVLTLVLRGLVRMGVAAIGGCGRAADTAWGEATMVGWWICGKDKPMTSQSRDVTVTGLPQHTGVVFAIFFYFPDTD